MWLILPIVYVNQKHVFFLVILHKIQPYIPVFKNIQYHNYIRICWLWKLFYLKSKPTITGFNGKTSSRFKSMYTSMQGLEEAKEAKCTRSGKNLWRLEGKLAQAHVEFSSIHAHFFSPFETSYQNVPPLERLRIFHGASRWEMLRALSETTRRPILTMETNKE